MSCGLYSVGKERIFIASTKMLNTTTNAIPTDGCLNKRTDQSNGANTARSCMKVSVNSTPANQSIIVAGKSVGDLARITGSTKRCRSSAVTTPPTVTKMT